MLRICAVDGLGAGFGGDRQARTISNRVLLNPLSKPESVAQLSSLASLPDRPIRLSRAAINLGARKIRTHRSS